MKKLLLLIGITILIGCTNADEKLLENKDFQLTVEMGSGWTEWSQKTNISGNGVMILTEQREKPEPFFEQKFFHLSNEEADSLKYKITQLSHYKHTTISLDENIPTDYPTLSVIYALSSKNDTISSFNPIVNGGNADFNNLLLYVYQLRQKYDPHYYLLTNKK